ncbi:MAG: VanZ family protein [Sandaracinaceae bacterium]
MALIWTLSSFALPELPVHRVPLKDKGIHLVEYAVLGFLLAHACVRTWPRHARVRTMLLAALIAGLWGLLDEIHQSFVPGRSAEVLDLVADGVGALGGAALRALPRLGHRVRPERVSEGAG